MLKADNVPRNNSSVHLLLSMLSSRAAWLVSFDRRRLCSVRLRRLIRKLKPVTLVAMKVDYHVRIKLAVYCRSRILSTEPMCRRYANIAKTYILRHIYVSSFWTFVVAIIIQQDATEYSLFKSCNCATCFRWYFTHHQELITLYLQYLALMRPVLLPVVNVAGRLRQGAH